MTNGQSFKYCMVCGTENTKPLCEKCKEDLEIVSVVGMKFQKVNGGYIPLSFLLKYCPVCGTKLYYRKTHHYGPEGKWCDKCNGFIYRTW